MLQCSEEQKASLDTPLSKLEELKAKKESSICEIEKLRQKLAKVREMRKSVRDEKQKLNKKSHDMKLIRLKVLRGLNRLNYEKQVLLDRLDSTLQESKAVSVKLQKYLQMNSLNDCFFIWFMGPFSTINNFRLGLLPSKQVDWTEINAAFGQAVLLLHIVYTKSSIPLKKFFLMPMGSFPKVAKVDDRRTQYLLYYDNSFVLFPKRNFNLALSGFVTVIHEIGEHIQRHDPTLCLPYQINLNNSTVNDLCYLWANDDALWTRTLKYLLCNIKWILAWYTKHFSNTVPSIASKYLY